MELDEKTKEKIGVIDILDEIGADYDSMGYEYGVKKLTEQLADMKQQGCTRAILRINSPGGSVYEALGLYDMLRSSGLHLRSEVYGLAASAATLVALAADEVLIAPSATWMVHEPVMGMQGSLKELRAQIGAMEKARERVYAIYAEHTGRSVEELEAMLETDHYCTAAEALKEGWVTAVLETPDKEMETPEDDDEAEETPDADPETDTEPAADADDTPENNDEEEKESIVARVLRTVGITPSAKSPMQQSGMSPLVAKLRLQVERERSRRVAAERRTVQAVNMAVSEALASHSVKSDQLPRPLATPKELSKSERQDVLHRDGINALISKLF